jgi:hypothetical protein
MYADAELLLMSYIGEPATNLRDSGVIMGLSGRSR